MGNNSFLTNNVEDYEKLFTEESWGYFSCWLVFNYLYCHNVCVMKWDRDEWQGRTQKQVEENYKTMEIL